MVAVREKGSRKDVNSQFLRRRATSRRPARSPTRRRRRCTETNFISDQTRPRPKEKFTFAQTAENFNRGSTHHNEQTLVFAADAQAAEDPEERDESAEQHERNADVLQVVPELQVQAPGARGAAVLGRWQQTFVDVGFGSYEFWAQLHREFSPGFSWFRRPGPLTLKLYPLHVCLVMHATRDKCKFPRFLQRF